MERVFYTLELSWSKIPAGISVHSAAAEMCSMSNVLNDTNEAVTSRAFHCKFIHFYISCNVKAEGETTFTESKCMH